MMNDTTHFDKDPLAVMRDYIAQRVSPLPELSSEESQSLLQTLKRRRERRPRFQSALLPPKSASSGLREVTEKWTTTWTAELRAANPWKAQREKVEEIRQLVGRNELLQAAREFSDLLGRCSSGARRALVLAESDRRRDDVTKLTEEQLRGELTELLDWLDKLES